MNNKNDKKKTVEIDITDIYDRIKKLASDEVRTVEEQIKYMIKKSLDTSVFSYSYTYCPRYNWSNTSCDLSTSNAHAIPLNGSRLYCSTIQPVNETVAVNNSTTECGGYVKDDLSTIA